MISRSFGTTGRHVPVVGQGTWPIPDRDALRRGIELGLTHIDTAEMYGDGRSEEIVGEAIAPFARDSLFLVSKVLPSNATARGIVRACERSLARMRTSYLDCYLLHWRGDTSLEDAMRGLERLVRDGKIRSLGVSNLDPWDLREAQAALASEPIACNQVLYNLGERTIEAHEEPWLLEHGAALVAYTPLARPRTAAGEATLAKIAKERDASAEAIALAFLLRHENAFVVPKANTIPHVEANARAGDIQLTKPEIEAIAQAFPLRERNGALPMN